MSALRALAIATLLTTSACGTACPAVLYFALRVTVVDVNGVRICDATVTDTTADGERVTLEPFAETCDYVGAQNAGEHVVHVSRAGYADATETVTVSASSGQCAHAVQEHVDITLRR